MLNSLRHSLAQWINPSSPKKSSGSGRYLNPVARDRLGNITQELEPDNVANALRLAANGDIRFLQEIYMQMYATDAHMRSEVNKLGMALSNYPLRVSVAKSKTDDAYAAAEMMEEILASPDLKARRLIRSMSKVHFTGLRIYEHDFEIEPAPEGAEGDWLYLRGMKLVPPTRYRMEMRYTEPDYGKPRILAPNTTADHDGKPLSEYPEGSLTLLDDGEEDGFYDLGGVGRVCLFWYCAKHFNAKWWAELNETYGEPVRVGYYDEWTSDEDRNQLKGFLEKLGRSAWAMFSAEQEVEFISTEISGQVQTYSDLINVADSQMSKAIVGQIGSSGRDQHGSYGEVVKLDSIRYEIVQAVEGIIEEGFAPLVGFLCRANIDPDFSDRDVPRVYVVVPNPEEKETKVKLFKGALEMGMEIPLQHARDELGIPEPGDSEDVLTPDNLLRRADGASQPENVDGDPEDDEEEIDDPDATSEPEEGDPDES